MILTSNYPDNFFGFLGINIINIICVMIQLLTYFSLKNQDKQGNPITAKSSDKPKTIIDSSEEALNIQTTQNKDSYNELLTALQDYLELPIEICVQVYTASSLFKSYKKVEAINVINEKLMPLLYNIYDLEKIEKVFYLLEGNLGLTKEDVHYYTIKLFNKNKSNNND